MRVLTTNSHTFFNVSRGQFLIETNDILAKMLEADNIFGFGSAWVDNLRKTTDHKARFFKHLLILSQIPLSWKGKSSIRLFDTNQLCNFLVKALDLIFDLLESIVVRTLSVPFE